MPPPPPSFHHSPFQVLAAISMALFSKGSEGSPGTVWNRHSILPVSGIIGADKPAYAEFRAAIADHDLATDDPRGAPVIV